MTVALRFDRAPAQARHCDLLERPEARSGRSSLVFFKTESIYNQTVAQKFTQVNFSSGLGAAP